MLPRCRTADGPFVIPPFDVQVRDVEGFMDELQAFQSVFHDCFARSEARAHFLDYMIGQYSPLARKSIEPIALAVEGGRIRSLQRFLSETVWDEKGSIR
jgi:SRSO17 transposase